jgi:peptide/nickel transport system permease protein
MLVGAQKELLIAPWTVIVPGAVITIAALAFNLAGDAIRDGLDPRLRQ